MFEFLKTKQRCILVSPVNGKVQPIESVPDSVFSTKMMGEGIAFVPETDTIYSPCAGKITFVADTKHAIGMTAGNGLEILIHVGLNTAQLNGKGLKLLIRQGDTVKPGTPLLQIDLALMKEEKINLIIPVVFLNSQGYRLQTLYDQEQVQVGTKLASGEKRENDDAGNQKNQ